MTSTFQDRLDKIKQQGEQLMMETETIKAAHPSDTDGDALTNVTMKMNNLIDDLASLKLEIGKNSAEIQDKIYESNIELEQLMDENKKMMDEQKKSKDAIDSSTGLEEQTNFNYYANLFFLILKILILGAIVYVFMFLDIFKSSSSSNKSRNLISPMTPSSNNLQVSKNTKLKNTMNQNASSKQNNKKQNIIINYNNS